MNLLVDLLTSMLCAVGCNGICRLSPHHVHIGCMSCRSCQLVSFSSWQAGLQVVLISFFLETMSFLFLTLHPCILRSYPKLADVIHRDETFPSFSCNDSLFEQIELVPLHLFLFASSRLALFISLYLIRILLLKMMKHWWCHHQSESDENSLIKPKETQSIDAKSHGDSVLERF